MSSTRAAAGAISLDEDEQSNPVNRLGEPLFSASGGASQPSALSASSSLAPPRTYGTSSSSSASSSSGAASSKPIASSGFYPSSASSSSYKTNGATFFVPSLKRLAAIALIQSLGGIEKTRAFLLQNPILEQSLQPTLNDFQSQAEKAARLLLLGHTITADAMVEANPLILTCVVDAPDHRRNKVRGDLIQIAALAGDSNIRNKKLPEKDHGMVQRWSAHLPADEVAHKIRATRPPGWEEETAARMQPYMDAAIELLNDLVTMRQQAPQLAYAGYAAFEVACIVPITKFQDRLAAIPDEQPVITTGLIFDLQMLEKFIEDLLVKNIDRLGGWDSVASDLYAIKGFGGLQMCASVCDLQAMVHRGGLYHVIREGELPDRSLHFSSGVPQALVGLGDSFFVSVFAFRDRHSGGCLGARAEAFAGLLYFGLYRTMFEKKQQHCNVLCNDPTIRPRIGGV
jgi:hypothetical protein